MFDKPASASFDPLASFARTSRRLSGYIRTRIFQTSPVPTVQTSPNVVDDTIKAESAAIASEPGDAADFDRKRAVAYQNRHASMPAPTNVRPAVDTVSMRDESVRHAAHSSPNAPATIVAVSMRPLAAIRSRSTGRMQSLTSFMTPIIQQCSR